MGTYVSFVPGEKFFSRDRKKPKPLSKISRCPFNGFNNQLLCKRWEDNVDLTSGTYDIFETGYR
jgi:hypothetical protein